MTNPLISVAELQERLGELTLLDVRFKVGGPWGRDEYAVGHVPGAVYVDLDTDLAAAPGAGGRHPLPTVEDFGAAMRRAGVSRGRPVVVYDDWSGLAAARCWWLLRHHGLDDVRVLDGGWSAWLADGGAAEAGGGGPVDPGDFRAGPGEMSVVEGDDVLDVAVLLDVRSPDRFRGDSEPLDPVGGHIPGALNLPTSSSLGPDGRFRSAAELKDSFAALGAHPVADVAAYCGSGVTAAHSVLAMEVAGIEAALYPGSWSEWSADPDRPVETGASQA